MEDMEQKIRQVLNDPEQMQSILQLAKSFLPEQTEQKPQTEQPQPAQELSAPLMQLLSQMGKTDPRQENLLKALKPLLRPGRREKIDRALQAAKLSHLAGFVLQGRQADEA